MKSYVTSGFSSQSRAGAIGSAIGAAHSEAGRNHLIILGVTPVAGGWVAIILVMFEPELQSMLEKRLQREHEEEEYKKTHPEKDSDKIRHQDLQPEQHLLENVHAFLPAEYNGMLEELELVKKDFDQQYEEDLHYHFIEKGPLWDNIQDMALELDFNLAAFPSEQEITYGDSRVPHGLDKKPNQRLQKPLLEDLELDG